jgi:diadenosine tetraphosphate (Ap4A) HIT family hydrolase
MPENILFPNEKVIVTDNFDVHQDMEVPIPGFLVMASIRNIKSILEFNEAETKEFLPLLIKIRSALKQVLKVDEVYFFQNEDSQHSFHIWIFPRLPWMEKFGRKIQSVRPIIEYAKEKMDDDNYIEETNKAIVKLRGFIHLD